MIHFAGQTLRVIHKRDDDADQPPVLVVQDLAEYVSSRDTFGGSSDSASSVARRAP